MKKEDKQLYLKCALAKKVCLCYIWCTFSFKCSCFML